MNAYSKHSMENGDDKREKMGAVAGGEEGGRRENKCETWKNRSESVRYVRCLAAEKDH